MPGERRTSADYDFATVCTEAIFLERTSRMARGEQLLRSDVVRIIREQDALRLDRAKAAIPCDPSPFGNRKAIPPTPEQVAAYSASIGYPMDGKAWCDAYEAKGWVVSGKNKMKDWQAAVRNWKTNGWGLGTVVKMKCTTTADTTNNYTRF